MLTVVGGSYLEFCREPHWSELYGSGLRAAAALAKLSSSVNLQTYCDPETQVGLEAITTTFDINCVRSPRTQSIGFSYHHPFSIPRIYPAVSEIAQAEDFKISQPHVLRFGMLEGQAIVNADRAIYDPQSAIDPRPFRENGSEAKHLAIVANAREGRLMTGKEGFSDIGFTLLANQRAEAVVLKCGPLGCFVFTSSYEKRIPVFETDYVWPIGSGDIFAAVFAHFWGELNMDASDAALKSSLYTAFYCDSRSLPLPMSLEGFSPRAIELDPARLKEAQVYLAGPFFSMSERWMIEETRNVLIAQGLNVFSPLHDVGRGSAAKVAPLDIKGIEDSSVMLALLDGRDVGTVFEVGYARKQNIPVIGLAESVGVEDLKMIVGTGCQVVDDFSTAIYKTVWSLKK